MGCGCGGGSATREAEAILRQSGGPSPAGGARIAVYQVLKGGEVVTTTESPVAARQESNRLGGSIRVSSREATDAELVAKGIRAPQPVSA